MYRLIANAKKIRIEIKSSYKALPPIMPLKWPQRLALHQSGRSKPLCPIKS